MEENENKEVKRKLTYEELNNVCHQLQEQNRKLYEQLKSVNMANIFTRLDYLFKVVENSEKFDSDFVITCTDEIKDRIIIKTVEDTKEE